MHITVQLSLYNDQENPNEYVTVEGNWQPRSTSPGFITLTAGGRRYEVNPDELIEAVKRCAAR